MCVTLVLFMTIIVLLFEIVCCFFFFFKQKTAYEMRISDWSSDVCFRSAREPDRGGGERDPDVELGVGEGLQRAREVLALGLEVVLEAQRGTIWDPQIGRASCRERVGQYV